jgi:hypothetical protein
MRFSIVLVALVLLVACQTVVAEIPHLISYQGVLRDAGGNVVPDGQYTITFKIYAGLGLIPLWTEVQTIQISEGILNAKLGSVTPLDLPFDQPYWLAIKVGGDPELSPRIALTAAPYAFRAAVADVGADDDWTISGSDIYRLTGNVGIGTATPTMPLEVVSTGDRAGQFKASSPGCLTHVIDAEYNGTPAGAVAVNGSSNSGDGYGIGGYFVGGSYGVVAASTIAGTQERTALYASASGSSGPCYGVRGYAGGSGTNYAIHGTAYVGATNYAGYFSGNVSVIGTLSKTAGSFKIDHPLDPAGKYLQHSFVESPDMMDIYNGNAELDGAGEAWVELPDWFEALNQDFRYQLTPIGAPGPNLYVAEEVSGNRFKIAGGEAGMKVSWQLTGIRHDAYADAHRIAVEVEKPANERGKYLHPELLGLSRSMAVGWIEEEGQPQK